MLQTYNASRNLLPTTSTNARTHLQRQHDENNSLVATVQERFHERPPRADEQNHHEESDPLEEGEEVVDDAPRLGRPREPEVMIPDGLEQHGQGLEHQ